MMIRWLNREILIGTGSNEFGWISTSSVDPFLSFPSTLQSITGFVNVLHVSSTVIHDERLEHERFLLISILLLDRLHDFHRNVQIDRVYNSKHAEKPTVHLYFGSQFSLLHRSLCIHSHYTNEIQTNRQRSTSSKIVCSGLPIA